MTRDRYYGAGTGRPRHREEGPAGPPTSSGDAAHRSPSAGARRGQTTLDFAVGVSLFVLTLSFVVLFVPGLVGSFTGGVQSDIPTADRVADDLATRTLGSADDPYRLDPTCTREFFETGVTPPAECRFTGTTVEGRVGVLSWRQVNVTISGNVTGSPAEHVLYWDHSDEAFAESGDGDYDDTEDQRLAAGPSPAGSGGETVSARRVASLDGEDVTIEVVMW